LKLAGKPPSDAQSALVRRELARKLGLPPKMLEAQKDEIRQLQREVFVQLEKESAEDSKADAALKEAAGIAPKLPKKSQVPRSAVPSSEEIVFTDAADAMRTHLMELQGLKYGALSVKEKKEEKSKRRTMQGAGAVAREVEDDYLAGPLSVESYVVFRVRPLIEHYEKRAVQLANRLIFYETLTFVLNSSGAVLAIFGFYEWVTLTVAVVAVLSGVIEFTQLRSQVVSVNLSLRDLQKLIVWWDSLSAVYRRTVATKSRVVDTTERAIVQIVDEHTTAASSTQLAVDKSGRDGQVLPGS